jgi:hypothetical protein
MADREELLDRLVATDSGALAPTREQWRRHLEHEEEETFVVVNLLTLKDQAALDRYAADAMPKAMGLGAELIHLGPSQGVMVGEEDDGCDMVSVWRWSRKAWTELWSDPTYADLRPLFNEGVARYRCIATGELRLG